MHLIIASSSNIKDLICTWDLRTSPVFPPERHKLITYATFLRNGRINPWILCDYPLFWYYMQSMPGRSEATSRRSGAVGTRDIFTTKMFGSIQILNTLSNIGFYGPKDEGLQQPQTYATSCKWATGIHLVHAEQARKLE